MADSHNEKKDVSQVERAVRTVLAMHLGVTPESLKPTDHLGKDLGCDSLDEVEILMALEDELNISIPQKADQRHFTVQELIDYCAARPTREQA